MFPCTYTHLQTSHSYVCTITIHIDPHLRLLLQVDSLEATGGPPLDSLPFGALRPSGRLRVEARQLEHARSQYKSSYLHVPTLGVYCTSACAHVHACQILGIRASAPTRPIKDYQGPSGSIMVYSQVDYGLYCPFWQTAPSPPSRLAPQSQAQPARLLAAHFARHGGDTGRAAARRT